MKFVNKIMFLFVLVGGLSVAVMAQRGEKPKPVPPKDRPPVVTPREKPPRENPPKGEEKPKKPGMAAILRLKEGSETE